MMRFKSQLREIGTLIFGAAFCVWASSEPLAYRLSDPADMAKPDYVKAAASLPNGDVVVALIQSDSIAVDKYGHTLSGKGSDTGVIVYDHVSGEAKTRFSFGGNAPRVVPHGIAVDKDGGFVVVGYAAGNGASRLDMGGGSTAFHAAEVPFVARFDKSGQWQWSHVFHGQDGVRPAPCPGSNCDRAWDVALSNDGQVVVIGGFSGRLTWPGGEWVSKGDTDIFVAVIGRNGTPLAGWSIGGPGTEAGRKGFAVSPGGLGEMGVAISNGTIAIQGTFGKNTEFGGLGASSVQSPSNGERDVFLARYDFNGKLKGEVWSAHMPSDTAGGFAAPGALRSDTSGHLYVSLRTPSGGTAWPGCNAPRHRGERTLVAAFDANLRCRWSTAFDFASGGIHRTLPDEKGHVFVAGWFTGRHRFTNQNLQSRSRRSDVFIAKLDAHTGEALWGSGLISTSVADVFNIPAGLAIDGSGQAWMGGQFFTPIEVAQNGQTSQVLKPSYTGAASNTSGDGFVVRFDTENGQLK